MTHFVVGIAWPKPMGNVTIIYSEGIQWLNRAMVKGFCNQPIITNTSLVGDVWAFEYTPAALRWEMKIDARFLPPSSNTYSLDFVFDLPNCWSFVGGVHSPLSVAIALQFIPGEGSIRIGTQGGNSGDPLTAVNLAPLSGYWGYV